MAPIQGIALFGELVRHEDGPDRTLLCSSPQLNDLKVAIRAGRHGLRGLKIQAPTIAEAEVYPRGVSLKGWIWIGDVLVSLVVRAGVGLSWRP